LSNLTIINPSLTDNQREEANGFLDIFGKLEDPRREQCKLHQIPKIILLTLCSVICGAGSWIEIEDFGYAKLDFLRRYLPYKNGVPSDDTFGDFTEPLIRNSFNSCLLNGLGVAKSRSRG
jgi:hypothetical protein